MIKKITAFFLMSILFSMLFFVAGSVANASLHISEWGEDARGIIAMFWVLSQIASIVVSFHIETILNDRR
jgi:nucleoside recognition membrane protein YjiH